MNFILSKRNCLKLLSSSTLSTVSTLSSAQTLEWPANLASTTRTIRVAFQMGRSQLSKEIMYWQSGQYNLHAHRLLSQLCLDQRALQAVHMDPRLFDVIFITQQWSRLLLGHDSYHLITSAYRTENTNQLVGGTARSQHLLGRALDGKIIGLELETYAQMLMTIRAGGVGLYNSHVHWDVGRNSCFWRG